MDPVLRVKGEIRRMEAAYPAQSGLQAAQDLSDCIDIAICDLWKSAGGPVSGSCLVAIGGYGRRQMSPRSDIDLLVLHRKKIAVAKAVRALSYSLWDTGFELGLLTSTEKEAHKLAAGDLDTRCAFLDARFVAGDPELFQDFREESLEAARRLLERFKEELLQASLLRWSASGDAGADLEPDLKRSKGALRDIAVLGWMGTLTGRRGSAIASDALEEGLDVLLSVRQGLHLETGRQTDLLSMQLQIPVARKLGMDEFELMRRLYESCRPVALAVEEILLGPDDLSKAAETFSRLSLPAFGDSGERAPGDRGESQPALERAGRREPVDENVQVAPPVHWPERARRAFFEILAAGPAGRRAFRAMDVSGALPAALPEWNNVRHRAQRNIYHRWAVDIHCYETVCELVEIARCSDDFLRRIAEDSAADWESLLVAALLHDIGKGAGEDHSILGERLAEKCSSRMGLRASAVRDVCWLVRNHLLLSQVATRRDISEESLIVDLAETVGSERRLRMLYLISVADGKATGPSAWTPWNANLVSQLFSEVHHLLERKELVGGDTSRKANVRLAELRAQLAGLDRERVEHHLGAMPRAWLLSQDPSALLRQSLLMLEPKSGHIRLEARPNGEEGIWEVTVIAPDRPGLFSKVSGALALNGFGVVSAQIFTREDGLALEVFRVEVPPSRDHRFEKVAADAGRAVNGDLSLKEALSRKRRDYSKRVEKGKQEPPEVIVDNRASDFYSVIEVHATDRIGLLSEITSALTDLGMDIHLAKVATYAEDVVDSFYVRDLDGQKISDPERIQKIRDTVLANVLSVGPDSI